LLIEIDAANAAAAVVCKTYVLRVTGANAAWGRNYNREFSIWIKQHGFEAMAKSVRSVAIELHENAKAIEVWRATLPERHCRCSLGPDWYRNMEDWRQNIGPHQCACDRPTTSDDDGCERFAYCAG
jgi:hypothetical protein